MGTQIELRHLAFFGAMDAVSKEEVGEEPAAEKKDDGKGEAASSYAASPVSPPPEKGSGQKVSLFADCSEIKGTKPLTVPYTVGGKKESVSVCVEGASKMMLESTAGRLDGDIKTALGKVVPATVQIKVAGVNRQEWSGSGFILDPEDATRLLPGVQMEPGTYFIHTNHHVAAEADAATSTHPQKETILPPFIFTPSSEPPTSFIAARIHEISRTMKGKCRRRRGGSATRQSLADFRPQRGFGEGFLQEQDARVKHAVVRDHIRGIPRHEHALHPRPLRAEPLLELDRKSVV